MNKPSKDKFIKIMLVGGGTGGSVSPLLAVSETIKKIQPSTDFVFLGRKKSTEEAMVSSAGIKFISINGGKWRRYFSFKNFLTPFQVLWAFFRSLGVLRSEKPDCVFGTGSFLQVPVMWAAYFLKIPVVIHQQDVLPTLSNKLCAPVAKRITVTFEFSKKDFPQGASLIKQNEKAKVVWTGNPVVSNIKKLPREESLKYFGLDTNYQTLLILGGSSGAAFINGLVWDNLEALTRIANVIHQTGKGKGTEAVPSVVRYYVKEFFTLDEMSKAYSAADLVISRAGLSTISELSLLAKPSIIIPMPESHQTQNAILLKKMEAAMIVQEDQIIHEVFAESVRSVLFKHDLLQDISKNIKSILPEDSSQKVAKIILDVVENARKS